MLLVSESPQRKLDTLDTNGGPPAPPAIDYSGAIAHLKLFLTEHELLGDEKAWVDRPVREIPAANAVEVALSELKKAEREGRLNADAATAILDRCFAPITQEVHTVKATPSEFAPSSTSMFAKSLTHLERLGTEVPEAKTILSHIAQTGVDALQTFAVLQRQFVPEDMPAPPQKEYTPEEMATAIGLADKYLGKGNVESALYDPVYDWNQSLARGKSSLIQIATPVIVPGGRFVEIYYWDSYWIIRGLALAGKFRHAQQQLCAFFSFVDRFGFMPNGSRRYYLDRSQPPIIAASTDVVVEALREAGNVAEAIELEEQALPRLLREYLGFWMNPRTGHIVCADTLNRQCKATYRSSRDVFQAILSTGSTPALLLNRYYSSITAPRPESLAKDTAVIHMVNAALANGEDIAAGSAEEVMREIRAAAESGWDFSIRWSRKYISGEEPDPNTKRNHSDTFTEAELREFFKSIDTTSVLPVDLNALLYDMERTIARFLLRYADRTPGATATAAKRLGDVFANLAIARHTAMRQLMWDSDGNVWRDWDLKRAATSRIVSAASVVPLWAGLSDDMGDVPVDPSLLQGWGIVPTMFFTGQQWDSPNVWAPLLHFAVEYLDRSQGRWDFSERLPKPTGTDALSPNAGQASWLAKMFLLSTAKARAANIANKAEGLFYEKYNTLKVGSGGSGGEYANQVGFGWTNGLEVELVARFGGRVTAAEVQRDLQWMKFLGLLNE